MLRRIERNNGSRLINTHSLHNIPLSNTGILLTIGLHMLAHECLVRACRTLLLGCEVS